MVTPIASCSWDRVRQAGEEVLKENNIEALTWGQFKRKLAESLDIDVLLLKVHRDALQDLVRRSAQEERTSDQENQDDEEDQESDAMTAMRALARAMSLG